MTTARKPEIDKRYRERNQEKVRARSRDWARADRIAHPEKYADKDRLARKLESAQKWYEANPNKRREYASRSRPAATRWRKANPRVWFGYNLYRTYKIRLPEFDRMLIEQQGCCASCNEPNLLEVDHDHTSGDVRALLCHPCNTMIGFAKDSPHRLRAAAAYLEAISCQ